MHNKLVLKSPHPAHLSLLLEEKGGRDRWWWWQIDRQTARQTEKHWCDRETPISCLLGVEPATFWCTDDTSTSWATWSELQITVLPTLRAQFSGIEYTLIVVQPSLPSVCRTFSSSQTETLLFSGFLPHIFS